MYNFILKRILLVPITLLGVLIVNFAIINYAPGGPIEQTIAKLKGFGDAFSDRYDGGGSFTQGDKNPTASNSIQEGQQNQGFDPEIVAEIRKVYGLDKPASERFFTMLKNYVSFDFGKSLFRDETVINLIKDKLPVSISIGIWTTFLVYLISIPLGIKKAVKDGSNFDISTSFIVTVAYAIPSFLFAILLIVLFASGSFVAIFPLRGLTSDNFDLLPWYSKILDYLWHITLPVIAMVISGFASLTFLTKNSFLDEISKQYVLTARAKGCSENRVMYKHIFRNAMLIVIAGFPAAFIGIFFAGSLLIEVIFSLDGLGLLGFEAVIARDYPIIFSTLFIFTLLGLVLNIVSDITYVLIDPRINFEGR
jgi:microcin C transport system permease protein